MGLAGWLDQKGVSSGGHHKISCQNNGLLTVHDFILTLLGMDHRLWQFIRESYRRVHQLMNESDPLHLGGCMDQENIISGQLGQSLKPTRYCITDAIHNLDIPSVILLNFTFAQCCFCKVVLHTTSCHSQCFWYLVSDPGGQQYHQMMVVFRPFTIPHSLPSLQPTPNDIAFL